MKNLQNLEIAIIGTVDQTSLMRLAGVNKYFRIEEKGDGDFRESVRSGLDAFLKDPSIGIIMIPENWIVHVSDMLERMRKAKGVTKKAIIEYPPGLKAEGIDVKAYYKDYTRKLIGFNVEI